MSSLTQDLPYGTSKKSSSRGKIAVLRMGNLQQGEIDYSDLVYSSDKEDIDKYLLTYGDLLFNRTNSSEWVGKTAIYRGEVSAIYAGYLIRIRSFLDAEYLNSVMNSKYASYLIRYRFEPSIVIPEYVNILFMTPLVREQIAVMRRQGGGQYNLNSDEIGAIRIPVPSIPEQQTIINFYNATKDGSNKFYEEAKELKDKAKLDFEQTIFSL